MGLGKTVITLGLVLANPSIHPASYFLRPASGWSTYGTGMIPSRGTLVICSVSLVGQWIKEAEKKLPDSVSLYAYHGQHRKRDPEFLASHDIIVSTYATVASDEFYHRGKHTGTNLYVAPLAAVKWHRIVLDESHAIKSMAAAHTKATHALVSDRRWCVTGTPICTNIDDLYSQMKFIGLTTFNDKPTWSKLTNRAFRYEHMWGKSICSLQISPCLVYCLTNIICRHTMDQSFDGKSLLELPDKLERVLEVDLIPGERVEYDLMKTRALKQFAKWKLNPVVFKQKTLEAMSILLPLRQACSGGQITQGQLGAPLPLDANAPIVESMECSICLDMMSDPVLTQCNHAFCRDCISGVLTAGSQDKEPCPLCRKEISPDTLISARFGDNCDCVIDSDNSGTAAEPDISSPALVFKSKADVLLKELMALRSDAANAKVLIFSQFQSTLDFLKVILKQAGFEYRTLLGSMTRSQRTKALDDFQNDPPTTVFLLSTRAGAVGINLTREYEPNLFVSTLPTRCGQECMLLFAFA